MKVFEDYIMAHEVLSEDFKIPAPLKRELPNYSINALVKLITRHKQYKSVDWQSIEVKKRTVYSDLTKYLFDPTKLFVYILKDKDAPYKPKPGISFNDYTLRNVRGEQVDTPKYGAFVGGSLWDLTSSNPIMINTGKYIKNTFHYGASMLLDKKDIKAIYEIVLSETERQETELDKYKKTDEYIQNLFRVAIEKDAQIVNDNLKTTVLPDIKNADTNDIRYVVSDEFRKVCRNDRRPSKELEQRIKKVYDAALPKTKKLTDALERIMNTIEDFRKKHKISTNSYVFDEVLRTSLNIHRFARENVAIGYNEYQNNSGWNFSDYTKISDLKHILEHPIQFFGETQRDIEADKQRRQDASIMRWVADGGTLD